MKYFTADTHFSHANIIEYCNRPFKNLIEMDTEIIRRWNKTVSKDDDIYILGDFAMAKYRDLLRMYSKELNGNKHLIIGNHDKLHPLSYLKIGFKSIHAPYLEIDGLTLIHDPALSQADNSRQYLCGHVHNLFKRQKNCYNVGVDVHNFYPQSIDFIKEELNG